MRIHQQVGQRQRGLLRISAVILLPRITVSFGGSAEAVTVGNGRVPGKAWTSTQCM